MLTDQHFWICLIWLCVTYFRASPVFYRVRTTPQQPTPHHISTFLYDHPLFFSHTQQQQKIYVYVVWNRYCTSIKKHVVSLCLYIIYWYEEDPVSNGKFWTVNNNFWYRPSFSIWIWQTDVDFFGVCMPHKFSIHSELKMQNFYRKRKFSILIW